MANNAIDIPLGWPLPKRKSFLSNLAKSENGKYSHLLTFQGSQRTLPVYSVEIELPKYRLANGRTQAAQEKYLANHADLGNDFFERDTESNVAQKIQHGLLKEMVLGSDLYAYFKDTTNKQEQPLILSYDGYVVNGNRRLCAMREFYVDSPEKYAHFKHIDVVILPLCTSKDIDELEAHLQIQPDIKEKYTWISKACMLRARQTQHGYTDKQLSEIYDIPEKEIRTMLGQLGLADDYLKSRGKEKQYDIVEKDDYSFSQLQKARQQLKQPEEIDLATEISFIFIDNTDTIQGRLYDWIPDVKENLSVIVDELGKSLTVKEEQIHDETDKYSLFGISDSTQTITPLIEAVKDPINQNSVLEIVTDIIESQKQKKRHKVKANAVLKYVSDANANLRNAINCISNDSIIQGVDEQLVAIEQSIRHLRNWLKDNA